MVVEAAVLVDIKYGELGRTVLVEIWRKRSEAGSGGTHNIVYLDPLSFVEFCKVIS